MRKQIDAVLIHADTFLLGTLGKEFVQRFRHSQSELTGVFFCIERFWDFHSAFKRCDDPLTSCILAVFNGLFDCFTGRHTTDQIGVGDNKSAFGFIFRQFKSVF